MILKVAFLDVFHGDGAVVTFDQGTEKACIVVDGGEVEEAAKRLSAYLKYEKADVIDLLVATYIDSDHVNGLVHLLGQLSDQADSWNHGKTKCIKNYWGPKPDPDWIPKPKRERPRNLAVDAAATEVHTLEFVINSVEQNQALCQLVMQRIFNPNNIYYPSLQDIPPLDLFSEVELNLFAPDIQILDSDIEAKALALSNARYREGLAARTAPSAKKLTLEDLRVILAQNGETMANKADRDANNQSIVFKLTPKGSNGAWADKWSFLFAGDAEHESWERMRQTKGVREGLPSRVLKVPHHGSRNGIDEDTLRAIDPVYNIVSVGQKHGLPDGETLNLIRQSPGRELFCTERNNNKSKPGPCDAKNCLRGEAADFRSIRFVIDTDNRTETTEIFTINTKLGSIRIETDDIWCQEIKWPER